MFLTDTLAGRMCIRTFRKQGVKICTKKQNQEGQRKLFIQEFEFGPNFTRILETILIGNHNELIGRFNIMSAQQDAFDAKITAAGRTAGIG